MPAFPHSLCAIRFGDHAEQPSPVVARSDVERGIPRQRRIAADSLVAVPCTFLFKSKAESAGFESWFFGEALAGGGWFDFTLPRTGQVVTAQVRNGDIGALKPRSPDWEWSERSVVLEYVRPGFRTLPPGLHSVTPSQVLQVQRASTATFVDSAGVLQTAAAHVARYTYFSGKNIYSGPVDLVAGPGAANVSHFLRTSASGNPPALGFSEVVTVSFQLYQDALSAAVPGRLARVLVEWRSIPSGTSGNALVDSVALSPGARQSITITMPTSAVADFDFRITLGKVGGASEGTITAANVMVERDAVDTAYEPAARLLVESAASNLVPQSDNISLWTSNGATLSPTPVMAPDGSLSARVMPLVTGTMHQTVVLPVSQPVTVSQYIKPEPGASSVRLYLDGAGAPGGGVYVDYQVPGMVLAFAPPGVSRSAIRREPNGWYRVDFSFTPIAGFAFVHAHPLAINQAFWRTQVEPGLVVTSPIQTTTTAVTRAADVIQVAA